MGSFIYRNQQKEERIPKGGENCRSARILKGGSSIFSTFDDIENDTCPGEQKAVSSLECRPSRLCHNRLYGFAEKSILV
jgi:hypothetical protein